MSVGGKLTEISQETTLLRNSSVEAISTQRFKTVLCFFLYNLLYRVNSAFSSRQPWIVSWNVYQT